MSEPNFRFRKRHKLNIAFYILFCSLLLQTSVAGNNLENTIDEKNLKKIGQEIHQALLKKEIESLLKYDLKGEKIKGITYDAYALDKKELEDLKSDLYCYLFDTQCLRRIASKFGGKTNPFMKTAIFDFFKNNKDVQIEVLSWPSSEDHHIASVIYLKPSFKEDLVNVLSEGWPLDKWAQEFVACDFIRTQDGWRYYSGIFKVATSEDALGEPVD